MIAAFVDSLGIVSPSMWAYTYCVSLMVLLFAGIGIPSAAITWAWGRYAR